jgi:hypothetical protein
MEISGLPLHPLVVHAAVVLGPVAALAALAYAAVGRWRDWLRVPMVVVSLAAVASIGAAYLTGDSFLEANRALAQKPYVGTHEERAEVLLWLTLGFGVVAVAAGWLHGRPGAVRTAGRVLLALLAVAVLVQVVLVGDAGARAVWQGV